MHVEYLLIGQGLCGTFLSYELMKAGRSFVVIDEISPSAASRVAAGVINPVTGRRIVKTWMIDELIPFARAAYLEVEKRLDICCSAETRIADFFPAPQMRLAFFERLRQEPQYIQPAENEEAWREIISYDFGYGLISPCLLIDVGMLLQKFRKLLLSQNRLWEERFEFSRLESRPAGHRYKGLKADRLIFCDGINSIGNPWFGRLPFAPNKGEALIIEVPGLPRTHIFKKGLQLVPWKDNLFWAGSSYEWEFEHAAPSSLFREKTLAQLKQFLKLPFTLVDHWAAVRPATLERRPFIGMHPAHPHTGIFNGMGTKGCSLAPYFAKQFVDHLSGKKPLLPEADVRRFTRLLTKAIQPGNY